jgi:ribosomal protein L7/L12/DNA-directed RNA polymerase subunit RPC12/RpoP
MSVQSLNCPNCGAPITGTDGKSTVVCDHCGSVIALKSQQSAPAAPEQPAAPEPTYAYGQVPNQRPPRSDLTSVALGPTDAAHVIQLLRDNQELEAIQFYQSKAGGSLGEAKDAISAIQAGLRDAAAPWPTVASGNIIAPANLPEVRRLVEAGNTIAAIKAYRDATGLGLREAKNAVDALGEQLRQNQAGGPMRMRPPARSSSSGLRGCAASFLGLVILFMCIFGGCGTYIQTKAIYRCSMREIKAAVAKQEILAPPINGGYLVISPGFKESGDFSSWYLNVQYFAPVWGSNGWGVVSAHITADDTGWNNVSAVLYKDGRNVKLISGRKIECAQ